MVVSPQAMAKRKSSCLFLVERVLCFQNFKLMRFLCSTGVGHFKPYSFVNTCIPCLSLKTMLTLFGKVGGVTTSLSLDRGASSHQFVLFLILTSCNSIKENSPIKTDG